MLSPLDGDKYTRNEKNEYIIASVDGATAFPWMTYLLGPIMRYPTAFMLKKHTFRAVLD